MKSVCFLVDHMVTLLHCRVKDTVKCVLGQTCWLTFGEHFAAEMHMKIYIAV